MIRFSSKLVSTRHHLFTLALVFTIATLSPSGSFAQSVSLTPPSLAEYNALVADWQKKKNLLKAAISAKREFAQTLDELTKATTAQQAKIDGAKSGLNAAVLKVAEAKNRQSKIDTNDEDPAGEKLSQDLIDQQTELNTVISTSESLQAKIEAMKGEHEKLRSTVKELKNATAAAKAALSAADILVEAVKSAQEVIASNNSEGNGQSDLESDFFKDALKQADNARQYEQDANNALQATVARQKTVAEKLLETEAQLEKAKQAEVSAYKKFAAADEAFKKHQTLRQAERKKRDALIAEITEELNIAQEQLQAQQKILQNESLAMQDHAAKQGAVVNQIAELDEKVENAKSAFEKSESNLRTQQHNRAIQTAAILADLNASMRTALHNSAPGADTSTPSERLIIPAAVLFSENSAKLQNSGAVNLPELAAILRDTVSRIPEGLDWMIRVDSYTTESSDDGWALGHNRATALAKALVTNGKFDAAKVSANGIASASAVSDFTSDGWIEIVLAAR